MDLTRKRSICIVLSHSIEVHSVLSSITPHGVLTKWFEMVDLVVGLELN